MTVYTKLSTPSFAAIRSVQQRILLITIFLTLLAGVLTWWMLRHQLSPMVSASRALATLPDSNQLQQPLPITRQDEIGYLIGGFNGLLETLRKRESELVESESYLKAIVRERARMHHDRGCAWVRDTGERRWPNDGRGRFA